MRVVVVGGTFEEIGEPEHRCGDGFHEGWLKSVELDVTAITVVRKESEGRLRYDAGVAVDASLDGAGPGGRGLRTPDARR